MGVLFTHQASPKEEEGFLFPLVSQNERQEACILPLLQTSLNLPLRKRGTTPVT